MDQACLVPALPSEILWEIASWMMTVPGPAGPESGLSAVDRDSFYKPGWAVMDSFSTASKALRIIALKNWFRSVRIRSDSDWTVMSSQFSFIYKWTRVVQWHCSISSHELENASCGFARFGNPAAIRIYLPFQNNEEDVRLNEILRVLPRTIRELDVFDSLYPDPRLIISIAGNFPELCTLRLKQPSIWCMLKDFRWVTHIISIPIEDKPSDVATEIICTAAINFAKTAYGAAHHCGIDEAGQRVQV
ncbi:hypothetical protein M0805_003814 [Coniferiporia weirii]|nr:hypothetical protein M0805_003814 [Coniferiporia weirii]